MRYQTALCPVLVPSRTGQAILKAAPPPVKPACRLAAIRALTAGELRRGNIGVTAQRSDGKGIAAALKGRSGRRPTRSQRPVTDAPDAVVKPGDDRASGTTISPIHARADAWSATA